MIKDFSKELLVENEKNNANRVGERIRKCRIEKGMTMTELGEKVGLNTDRVQKYEIGFRRPKIDLLNSFAEALDVKGIALTDPVITNHIGAMYALFEMEELYGIEIEKNDNKCSVSFEDDVINGYLNIWYDRKKLFEEDMDSASEDEQKALVKTYHLWERNFPNSEVDNVSKTLRKAQIENKIKELQDELKKLD